MQSSLETVTRQNTAFGLCHVERAARYTEFRITVCRMSFPALYAILFLHHALTFSLSLCNILLSFRHAKNYALGLIPRSRKRVLFVSLRSTHRKHSRSLAGYMRKKSQNQIYHVTEIIRCRHDVVSQCCGSCITFAWYRVISRTNTISLEKSNKIWNNHII